MFTQKKITIMTYVYLNFPRFIVKKDLKSRLSIFHYPFCYAKLSASNLASGIYWFKTRLEALLRPTEKRLFNVFLYREMSLFSRFIEAFYKPETKEVFLWPLKDVGGFAFLSTKFNLNIFSMFHKRKI